MDDKDIDDMIQINRKMIAFYENGLRIKFSSVKEADQFVDVLLQNGVEQSSITSMFGEVVFENSDIYNYSIALLLT